MLVGGSTIAAQVAGMTAQLADLGIGTLPCLIGGLVLFRSSTVVRQSGHILHCRNSSRGIRWIGYVRRHLCERSRGAQRGKSRQYDPIKSEHVSPKIDCPRGRVSSVRRHAHAREDQLRCIACATFDQEKTCLGGRSRAAGVNPAGGSLGARITSSEPVCEAGKMPAARGTVMPVQQLAHALQEAVWCCEVSPSSSAW